MLIFLVTPSLVVAIYLRPLDVKSDLLTIRHRVFLRALMGGGGGIRNFALGGFLLQGGWNLKSDFDHLNLFQS